MATKRPRESREVVLELPAVAGDASDAGVGFGGATVTLMPGDATVLGRGSHDVFKRDNKCASVSRCVCETVSAVSRRCSL
jgi:hypothetical protein